MDQSLSSRENGCRDWTIGVSSQSGEDSVGTGGYGDRERNLIGRKESVLMCFEFMAIIDTGKMSLEAFGGSAGHKLFKKLYTFSLFPVLTSHTTLIIRSQILTFLDIFALCSVLQTLHSSYCQDVLQNVLCQFTKHCTPGPNFLFFILTFYLHQPHST
jgi:hypothetical protein